MHRQFCPIILTQRFISFLKENLFLQLKQYGCDSKEKGQTELDRLDGELKRLETEFDEGLSNLEKSYEWN